ncbi:MAG TPA: ABC transporter permease, partial [Gammaproteobacteria bacterium]|nr:ABC transporter permease [Gammaproteobacteria bacterium]
MALLKHAFRQLVLRPGLSATMIAMLALGIGAATAIFALFYQALVQPLPVPKAEQLVNIVRAGTGPTDRGQAVSYPMFNDLDAGQNVFTGIAGYTSFTAHVAYGEEALSLRGAFVSAQYFSVLGLQPAVGRLIGPQDVPRIGESAVVVLSHHLWQTRFGGDPNIVGRSLKINGQVLTVIGVAPARFSGTQLGVRMQVFAPITMRWRLIPVSGVDTPENRNFNWVRAFARLRSGVPVEQAAASLNTVYARIR